jgi:hypothetical protein
MPNDHEIIRFFSHGLHAKNFVEVEQIARGIISNMDNTRNFSVRWTKHDFARPFEFILRKGFIDIAKSPVINTIKDKEYPYYLALLTVLLIKNVDCKAIGGLFKDAEVHRLGNFIRDGKIIAGKIR